MPDNSKRTIYIRESEYEILIRHLDFCYCFMPASKGLDTIIRFETMFRRAAIVTNEHIPDDIIMINSQFSIAEIKSGVETDFILRLPIPTDCNEKNISILSPLGSAVIGRRVGDIFECAMPAGAKKFVVTKTCNSARETAA